MTFNITKEQLLEKSQLIPEFDSDFIFEEKGQEDDIFVDDGSLHIRINGTRICFEIGQEVTKKEFKDASVRIQKTLFGEVVSKEALQDF